LLSANSPPTALASVINSKKVPMILYPLTALPIFQIFCQLSVVSRHLLVVFNTNN